LNDPKNTKARGKKSRVYLVDDHPVTRQGFAQLIDFEPDLTVCGQAGTAAEATREILELKPDVVVVDISLPDNNGLELVKHLVAIHPGILAIMLSSHDEKIYAERSLRAGARGYLMKEAAIDTVLTGIRMVIAGEICVSDAMRRRLLGSFNPGGGEAATKEVDRLSDRELEVFRHLGLGRSTKEIADQLHVSISTIDTYRASIKKKLGLADATDLVSAAGRWVQKQL
jgi:DNA-binding NarL/FixJ family response regulator